MNDRSTHPFGLRGLVLAAMLLAPGCSEEAEDEYAPISRRCDACLSIDASGCVETWGACREIAACEKHVLCELRSGCYGEPASSSCSEDAGCALDSDASSEAAAASDEFETCARSVCSEACDFRER